MDERKLISAIILAGGYSSRMGRCKALLDFHGVSFLQNQIDKLRAVGIEDIVVSGYAMPIEGTRAILDIYPHCGPMSGLHAGLLAIRNPSALVVAVDIPLVPNALLEQLIQNHKRGITVVSHNEKIEPLIGVYDKSLSLECEKLLQAGDASIRRLFKKSDFSVLEYTGEPMLLMNCNTPKEYAEICLH